MVNRRAVLSLLIACFAVSLVLFRLTDVADRLRIGAPWAMVDFETAIYYPVVAFLAGENPYDNQNYLEKYPVRMALPLYLPSTLLLHLPFGLLSPGRSSAVYLGVTLLFTFGLAYVSLILTRQEAKISTALLIGGLILLTRAGHWNALLGQLTLQFVFASYAALFFAERSPIVSGLALAVSVVKPTFGIPIALLMLGQGYIRPVLYGAIVASVMNVPLLFLLAQRSGDHNVLFSLVVNSHDTFQKTLYNNPGLSFSRIDAVAFISRFMQEPAGLFTEVTIFVMILCAAAWALRRGVHLQDQSMCALRVGVVCLGTLLCAYHQAYDLLLLTVPFVGLVRRRFPDTFYSSYRYPLSLVLLSILALNHASTNSIMRRLVQQESGLWTFLGAINAAVLLTLFCIWLLALKEHSRSNIGIR